MKILSGLTVVLVALAGAGTAQGDPNTVDNEADLLSLVGEVTTEGFEGYPTEPCSSGGAAQATSISTSLVEVTTSPQGGGSSFVCVGTAAQGPDAGPRPTDGLNALIAGSLTGDPWTLSFSLTDSVSAVGFYLTDAAQAGDIFFATSDGTQYLMAAWPVSTANPLFFGFISGSPFSEFALINTGLGDGWGVDEIIMATVPEPDTPLRCDTNDDGTVDTYDIRFISANRNQLATGPDDPMDWDENGVIDILDARGCQQACTFPRCAAQ